MVTFTKPFFPVLLAVLLSTCVQAVPWPSTIKHATHRVHEKRDMTLVAYHPKSTFMTYGVPIKVGGASSTDNNTLVTRDDSMDSLRTQAFSFVETRGYKPDNVNWTSGFMHDNIRVAYLKQTFNGLPVANAVANVVMDGSDYVYAFGSSFVNSSKIADTNPTFPWRTLIPDLEKKLGTSFVNGSDTLQYFAKDDGSVALANVMQIGTQYEVFIDAHTGDILSLNDFVAEASYTVVPVTKISFADGTERLEDPADLLASPGGWHDMARKGEHNATSGNNVFSVFFDRSGGLRNPLGFANQSSDGLNFNYQYDDALDPQVPENKNAAIVNAFYVTNVMHDVSYRYGFTERNFNFQLSNAGKGGKEDDRLLLSVQDFTGFNNANFATPPDGASPVCRMFIWNILDPRRDGSLQNDIIIHEYAHGITNRLTGGGTARCLQTQLAGGLGEGWGDMFANWFQQSSETVTDFIMAQYVTGRAGGIRSFPYSSDQDRNPLTYADLGARREVHQIGEVWATMLHDVYASLVAARGFSTEKLTNPTGVEGNIVFMRLLMTALSLQPCNPDFVEARDAWFVADQQLFNGANRCTLARAFAGRGLGEGADNTFVNDFTVPVGC